MKAYLPQKAGQSQYQTLQKFKSFQGKKTVPRLLRALKIYFLISMVLKGFKDL